MNKTKILTVLGVCLAMGLTACGGAKSSEDAPKSSENPVSQSENPSSSEQDKSSSQQPTSSEAPAPQKDQTGHIWGADADVAADAEAGTVAYKRAVCTEEDKAVKYTVNQSVVTYASGSTRKDGTPEGYTKLSGKNQSWSFKIKTDKYLKGKVYLFGCMDGWSSNSGKKAFDYNGKPNIKVTINGDALDIAALANVVYTDFLGGSGSDLSDDGYGCLGDVVLNKGVNEFVYTRLESMNTLVKDIVFVGEELDAEWGEAQTVAAAGDGYVGYTKAASLLKDGVSKIEIKALDGTFAEGSTNKDGTEAGYLKLNSTGNKITWKFKYGSAAIGSIYQLGFMDSFSSNHDVLYSWTSTSGTHSPTLEGNLRVSINGNNIDRSAYINIRAEDLTKDGDATVFAESKNYSPLTVLPIGDLVLKNGDNVLGFERLGSYNYPTSTLILIVKDAAAEYAVEETLSSDDDGHFNKVTGTNVIFNKAAHTWEHDADKTDVDPTCSAKGTKYEKCSVCGKTRTVEVDMLPHTLVSDPDLASEDTVSTCTTHGVAHMVCSVCGAKVTQELPLGDHTWGEAQTAISDAVPHECTACHAMCYELALASLTKVKADVEWNVTGLPAGTYEVYAKGCTASTSLSQNMQSRYQFGFDGTYVALSARAAYSEFGFGSGEDDASAVWTSKIMEVTAGEGVAKFAIHWVGSGYSAYFAAIRLVKVA